ncbi:MAG: hypothetical protein AB1401_00630 [Thermodesulfobacteriota bacterium]
MGWYIEISGTVTGLSEKAWLFIQDKVENRFETVEWTPENGGTLEVDTYGKWDMLNDKDFLKMLAFSLSEGGWGEFTLSDDDGKSCVFIGAPTKDDPYGKVVVDFVREVWPENPFRKGRLFAFTLEERNGEQEYSYDHLVRAGSIEEAIQKAEDYASRFYGVEGDDEDGGYYFFGGCLFVKVRDVREMNESDWCLEMYRKCSID